MSLGQREVKSPSQMSLLIMLKRKQLLKKRINAIAMEKSILNTKAAAMMMMAMMMRAMTTAMMVFVLHLTASKMYMKKQVMERVNKIYHGRINYDPTTSYAKELHLQKLWKM